MKLFPALVVRSATPATAFTALAQQVTPKLLPVPICFPVLASQSQCLAMREFGEAASLDH